MVSVHFGKKVPYRVPPGLKGDVPEQEGEFILFIQDAAWRLDGIGNVICGSEDFKLEGSRMLEGLRSLVGRRVAAAKITTPAEDLEVFFVGKYVLRVFCSQTSRKENCNNYSFHAHDRVFVVEAGSTVSCEAR